MTGHDRRWPLTGREVELARVVDELRRGSGAVLVGDAGVGKSRLAREVAATWRDRDVRWVRASDSTRTVPLGAFASVLAPVLDGAPPTLPRAVAALTAAGRRALVVVDDAQQLDDLSAALVHQLASDRAVHLVLTVRTGDAAPAAVTALWKDDLLARIEVGPLDEQGTAALLAAALGAPLEVETLWRLHRATRGNVLWLRHLVEGERATGRLAPVAGHWRWSGSPALDPVLRDLVEADVGELDGPTRRLLELLALGEPLGGELLAGLVGAAVLERAAERSLVVIDADERRLPVRLAHPLYGDVARSRLDPWRLRRRRGELVDALEAAGSRRSGDLLRRAVLALDSDLAVDPALLVAAGQEAALLTALPLAERLFRVARDAGGGFEAQLALGLALLWRMVNIDEGLAELDRAVEEARDEADRVRAEVQRIGSALFLRGEDVDALGARVRAVLDTLPTDRARADLGGVHAMIEVVSGRADAADRRGSAVLADPGSAAHAVVWAGYAVVLARGLTGSLEGVDELTDRIVGRAAERAETALMVFNLRLAQLVGRGLAGRPPAARPSAPEAAGMHGEMVRAVSEAWAAFHAGRVGEARRRFVLVLPFFPGHGGGWSTFFAATLAQACGALGRAAEAREALARAREDRLPAMTAVGPHLVLAQAWLAAAEGAVGEAADHAVRAAVLAREAGQRAVEVSARHVAVCLGATDQAEHLAELAVEVDGPRAPLAAAHSAAWERRDAVALSVVSSQLEEAGLVLLAADAAAQASMLYRDTRRPLPARGLAARAAALAERAGGARTPALVVAFSPLDLSTREREVATLAHAGLSNRRIAERLGVSVRTVEGHVYRACQRLGAADRAALAALVAQDAGEPAPS